MLADRGAVVIDADRIAHEAIARGGPAYERVVERFGPRILAPDGSIDRAELGGIVFADAASRRDLEAITHPEIYSAIGRRLEGLSGFGGVVVLDAALLVETLPDRGRSLGLQALVVVAAEAQDQIERAVRERGLAAEGVRARLAAQAPEARKLAAADYVLDNRGTLEDLERSVDALWKDLTEPPGRATSAV